MAFLAFFFPYPHPAFVEDAPFMLKLLEDVDGLCLRIALHQQYSRSRHLDLEYCCHDGTPMDLTFSWKVILRVSSLFHFWSWPKVKQTGKNTSKPRAAAWGDSASSGSCRSECFCCKGCCSQRLGPVHWMTGPCAPPSSRSPASYVIFGQRHNDCRCPKGLEGLKGLKYPNMVADRKKWQEKIMEAQTLWLGDPVWLNGSEGWQA